MTTDKTDRASTAATALAEAIEKNEAAKNAVQDVADELSVVHQVLTLEVAEIVKDGDGATAVQRTAVLEKKLVETTEKMAEVNEALADQKSSLEHLGKRD